MDLSMPLTGMQNAETAFETAASGITQAFSGYSQPPSGTTPADSVDLSTQVVNLLNSKNEFSANVHVAALENDLNQSTFSILG